MTKHHEQKQLKQEEFILAMISEITSPSWQGVMVASSKYGSQDRKLRVHSWTTDMKQRKQLEAGYSFVLINLTTKQWTFSSKAMPLCYLLSKQATDWGPSVQVLEAMGDILIQITTNG